MFQKSLAVFALLFTASRGFENARFINEALVQEIKAFGKWVPFEVDQNPLRHRDISSMSGREESLTRTFASGLTSLLSKWNMITTSPKPKSSFAIIGQELLRGSQNLKGPLLPAFDARD